MTKIDKTWKAVVLMVAINLVVAIVFVIGLSCKFSHKTPYIAGARAIEYTNLQIVTQDDVAYLSDSFFEDNNLQIEDIYSGLDYNGRKNVADTAKRLGQVKLNFDLNKVLASQIFDKRIEDIESYEYTLRDSSRTWLSIKVQGIAGKDKDAKYEQSYGGITYSKIVKTLSSVYETQITHNEKASRLRVTFSVENDGQVDLTLTDKLFESALTNIITWRG